MNTFFSLDKRCVSYWRRYSWTGLSAASGSYPMYAKRFVDFTPIKSDLTHESPFCVKCLSFLRQQFSNLRCRGLTSLDLLLCLVTFPSSTANFCCFCFTISFSMYFFFLLELTNMIQSKLNNNNKGEHQQMSTGKGWTDKRLPLSVGLTSPFSKND